MIKRAIDPDRKDSLAAIGAATVRIAHEIANSVHVVGASIEVLQQLLNQQHDTTDPCILALTREVRAEVGRMKSMLDDLRDVARPPMLRAQPVSLRESLADTLRSSRLAGWSGTIEIDQEIPADLPPVFADEEKLAGVLFNLCVNACEAMPDGGILTVRGYRAGESVCLEVKDTGIGIPEDFDPFRPFNTTKKKGWGLGLSVVTEVVQALNGTLSYESRPGNGTTFRLCLPAAA